MTAVDFVITNPTHHLATVAPVAAQLANEGHSCRILSLCEVRGMPTPADATAGVAVVRVVRQFRRRARPGQTSARRGLKRRVARGLAWQVMVRPALMRVFDQREPRVIAVCNDIAYPNVPLLRLARRRGWKTVLLQEGIRFPLPVGATIEPYGTGRTDAIATWGAASAEYLVSQGVPRQHVHVTGSPRHDAIVRDRFSAAAAELGARLGGHRLIAVLTNPVDVQGLCSSEAKHRAVYDLTAALAPLASEDVQVVLKPHGGEDPARYRRSLVGSPLEDHVKLEANLPLYPLLTAADAVVVLASTVGLEALLLGSRLGVMEIPGRGFLHDYVDRGVGEPIRAGQQLAAMRRLLSAPPSEEVRRTYLDSHLEHRGQAAAKVAELIIEVAA